MKIEHLGNYFKATYKTVSGVSYNLNNAMSRAVTRYTQLSTITNAPIQSQCPHPEFRTYPFLREKKCKQCHALVLDNN